jgi:tRNA pseudouridine32 synthase/23S rRNA pseudouridine746 synthase
LDIIYEDDHIVAVNKPAGILSVPGKTDNPSLNKAVFDAVGCDMGRMDMMVVHRLGMDTSGVMVFTKTRRALKAMNKLFRNRDVSREYEALVVGHVQQDEGFIDLPLIRDYENAPYMRVSTDSHQVVLAKFTADDVHKKLLDPPKESITKYEVTSREEFNGQPVTRVTLTSLTGRTHQLSVHCAAFGHPIVGDKSYGIGGDAAPNGGLTADEMESLASNAQRASIELQEQIALSCSDNMNMCVHAKSISFSHPVTNEPVSLSSEAPF